MTGPTVPATPSVPYPSSPPTIDPNTGKEAANLSYYWNEYVVLPDGTLGAWVPYNPESQGYLSQYDPHMSDSLVGVHVGIPNATGGILDAVPMTIPTGALTVPAGGTTPPTQSAPVVTGAPATPTATTETAPAAAAPVATPEPTPTTPAMTAVTPSVSIKQTPGDLVLEVVHKAEAEFGVVVTDVQHIAVRSYDEATLLIGNLYRHFHKANPA